MKFDKESPQFNQLNGDEDKRSPLQLKKCARNIEGYLRENNLFYGLEPRKNGDASWYISLQNHLVDPEQAENLLTNFPALINSFCEGCGQLMKDSLCHDPAQKRLNKYLTAGVPEETQQLWEKIIGHGLTKIFSSRPDMILDNIGHFHVVEYNTDGGADRGNTQGVNDYSRLFLGGDTLGVNLAHAFVNEIRDKFPSKDRIVVATILPDSYRQEYNAQNIYFSHQADNYGNPLGIEWIIAKLSELKIRDNNVQVVIHSKTYTIDVLDREFKLPGFTSDASFSNEVALINAVIEGKIEILGSILPFQDKVLLGTLYDQQFSMVYPQELLPALRALHVETEIVDSSKPRLQFGDDFYTWDDIFNLRTGFPLVLKRGGDSIGSTGSKGLLISNDTNLETWKRDLDTALVEPSRGGSYWVLQSFYQSDKFLVNYVKNSRSQPKVLNVVIRFSPYYVSKGNGLQLGNILVTAGTDEETYKRGKNNIHGLRQNTYQAVSLRVK